MKKAYWIRRMHFLKRDEYVCSACKKSTYKPAKTCPFCGMTMGKTKYEPTWVDEAEGLSALFDD